MYQNTEHKGIADTLDEHLIFTPGFPVSYEQNSVKNHTFKPRP